jgi:hypothetical protein
MIAAGAAAATSLAVIRTDKEIVIAADSRVTRLSSEESMPDMCKVRQNGNAIAAFVGLVSSSAGRPTTTFDALGTVDAILDGRGTLAEKAERSRQHSVVNCLVPLPRCVDELNGFVLGVVLQGRRRRAGLEAALCAVHRGPVGALVSTRCQEGCPHGVVRIMAPPAHNLSSALTASIGQ